MSQFKGLGFWAKSLAWIIGTFILLLIEFKIFGSDFLGGYGATLYMIPTAVISLIIGLKVLNK